MSDEDNQIEETAITGGLIIGHSKDSFKYGSETILVLQDKHVLDEDTEEVLINPNLIDNERYKENVRKRKQKSDYSQYDDETFDHLGMVKKKNILDKYDDVISGGPKRESFRLDQSGGYDLEREEKELEMKRKLMMANKKFETLDTPKYMPAREFYTEEELLTFRKPTKKHNKSRKIRTLKASDLSVNEESANEKAAKSERLAARRQALENQTNVSEESRDIGIIAPTKKEKNVSSASVDLSRIQSFASKIKSDDESENEDLVQGVNLSGVVIDDEAEDELQELLKRTRKLQQTKAPQDIREILSSHTESKPLFEDGLIIDAVSEQYKMIGESPTFGLAGNRNDDVDYSELLAEHKRIAEQQIQEKKAIVHSDEEDSESQSDDEKTRLIHYSSDSDLDIHEEVVEKPMWKAIGEEEKEKVAPKLSPKRSPKRVRNYRKGRSKQEEDKDVDIYGVDYKNALGDEKDVTKGVAAMLRLAGEKGYLDRSNHVKSSGDSKGSKDKQSKTTSRIEHGRSEPEDKYIRKLERMSRTGSGRVQPFAEKTEYKPDVELTYADTKGRVLDKKEAFRELSHKFHGVAPGKKKIEKRQARLDREEKMKRM